VMILSLAAVDQVCSRKNNNFLMKSELYLLLHNISFYLRAAN
jgi:hypothetical protein